MVITNVKQTINLYLQNDKIRNDKLHIRSTNGNFPNTISEIKNVNTQNNVPVAHHQCGKGCGKAGRREVKQRKG